MNVQIKRMLLDSGLFEEDSEYSGIFFSKKSNYDATRDIEIFVNSIADEYVRSIENWRDADTESKETDYFRGYHDACNDIIEELEERFR